MTRLNSIPSSGNALGATPTRWAQQSEYDEDGNLVTITAMVDGQEQVTRFGEFDRFGQPGTITDPLGNTTENFYDFNTGRLTQTVDPRRRDYGIQL